MLVMDIQKMKKILILVEKRAEHFLLFLKLLLKCIFGFLGVTVVLNRF